MHPFFGKGISSLQIHQMDRSQSLIFLKAKKWRAFRANKGFYVEL